MRLPHRIVGSTTLALAAILAACGGSAEEDSPASQPEQTEVAYASASHGAVEVRSAGATSTDWFTVWQGDARAWTGNPPLLGNVVELSPGTYDVDVNRTRRTVTIRAGRKIVLLTGELVVEGSANGFWYPMLEGTRRVSGNPPRVGTAIALFAGGYAVYVNHGVAAPQQELGTAEVMAGRRTALSP